MRIPHNPMLGISLALVIALPALAGQQSNASVERAGSAAPMSQVQRDTMRQNRVTNRSQVYGWQLMTPTERDAYRTQMRSMKTSQERETLRLQHHEQMQKRAAERGVTLPDVPVRRGGGMGPGSMPMSQVQRDTMRQNRVTNRSQIYGWQLMTPTERDAYRTQMRSMKTSPERETLRLQHHEQMQKRAAERGVTLPDVPVRRGGGMSPGGMQQPTPPAQDQNGG